MNPSDFIKASTGRVIRTPQGFHAFAPAPLPPPISYDVDLVNLLSRADAALSELSGLGHTLPNPHLLIAPYVRREAVVSSRIEGTQASLHDLLIEELDSEAALPRRHEDVLEVRNYVLALEYGMARLEKLPLSLRLVREIHERLMRGVRGDRTTPGEFRRSQNWVGPSGSTPANAPFVPPPVREMHECLNDWEKFLHDHDTFPDLIHAAIAHAQFEAIHPFLDGNGRVGRLLITLELIGRKRLSQPLLYLSAFIEAYRQDYYELLQRIRTHGDWSRWIRYFLAGVEQIARDASGQTRALLDLRARLREDFTNKPRTQQLIDKLFENPYITVARAERLLKVSNPTARAMINDLVAHKVLEEASGRRWAKLYIARAILRIVEGTA
ncbi:MAG: Fic family protein [Burkholderiales bacterium]